MKTKKHPARIAKGMGSRLSALRIAKGWTQDHLAKLIGITHGEIYQLENDKRACPVPRLIALAEALGVSISYLATGKDN